MNTKIIGVGSNIDVKISLHDFEAYELSPYSKPSTIQRTTSSGSSMAGLGNKYLNVSTDTYDDTTQIPSIGVTEVRRNHKYTRLISRRYGRDQILQNKYKNITQNDVNDPKRSPKSSANNMNNLSPLHIPSKPLLKLDLEIISNNNDSEGICDFNLEELEVLISPSAGWI